MFHRRLYSHGLKGCLPDIDNQGNAEALAAKFGFNIVTENISKGLAGLGCYLRRDEAIKQVFPEFDSSYKAKIINPGNILEKDTFNFSNLTIMPSFVTGPRSFMDC